MINCEYYYHGSSLKACNNIIETKNVTIRKNIGTLGRGFYAFHCQKNNAEKFAMRAKRRKHFDHVGVLQFQLVEEYKENILDFTDLKTMNLFEDFKQKHYNKIVRLSKSYSNKGLSKKLDGAIVEAFVSFLISNNIVSNKIMGVYSITSNKFGKTYVEGSTIGNSYELCIRDDNLIDFNTIKLVREEKGL